MGDQIVLGIDANESVEDGPLVEKLQELGLSEAISDCHYPTSPPATYNRNTQNETIDGSFVSSGVEVTACGLAAFDS